MICFLRCHIFPSVLVLFHRRCCFIFAIFFISFLFTRSRFVFSIGLDRARKKTCFYPFFCKYSLVSLHKLVFSLHPPYMDEVYLDAFVKRILWNCFCPTTCRFYWKYYKFSLFARVCERFLVQLDPVFGVFFFFVSTFLRNFSTW